MKKDEHLTNQSFYVGSCKIFDFLNGHPLPLKDPLESNMCKWQTKSYYDYNVFYKRPNHELDN